MVNCVESEEMSTKASTCRCFDEVTNRYQLEMSCISAVSKAMIMLTKFEMVCISAVSNTTIMQQKFEKSYISTISKIDYADKISEELFQCLE